MAEVKVVPAIPEYMQAYQKYLIPYLQSWFQTMPQQYTGQMFVPPNPLQMFASQIMANLMGQTYPWASMTSPNYMQGQGTVRLPYFSPFEPVIPPSAPYISYFPMVNPYNPHGPKVWEEIPPWQQEKGSRRTYEK